MFRPLEDGSIELPCFALGGIYDQQFVSRPENSRVGPKH